MKTIKIFRFTASLFLAFAALLAFSACQKSVIDPNPLAPARAASSTVVDRGISLPDMDVVMGFTSPGSQSCPNASTTLSPTVSNEPGSRKKATFSWTVNEGFEVTLSNGTTSKKFRLNPSLGVSEDDAGTVTIYESSSFSCLTLSSSDVAAASATSMIITAIDNNCSIRGYNDGSTQTISIVYPGSYSITVKK